MGQLQQNSNAGLANKTLYLDVFGRVVVAWIRLRQALTGENKLQDSGQEVSVEDQDFYHGKLYAARFHIEWELPEITPPMALLQEGNLVPFSMNEAWF